MNSFLAEIPAFFSGCKLIYAILFKIKASWVYTVIY
ncbi:hypothetical protein SAMN04489724_3088 [Algoriphagus locisalis]|uniref:Uncharacterized protein n=1 Tax=Algoriphagus locisalis TaxID=305507 RepID=A0A1I7CDI4_9BACT|nr:hypothetical protein SAMN04489724_3088 [Algoriphagus locisalis]